MESEQHWAKGELNGTSKRYYDDGTLQSTSIYENGKKKGLTTYYNKNGSKVPSDNHVVFYYSNGNIESERVLKNGKIEGLLKKYYTNGNLKHTFTYQNDILNGVAISYTPTGKIIIKNTFKDGKISETE